MTSTHRAANKVVSRKATHTCRGKTSESTTVTKHVLEGVIRKELALGGCVVTCLSFQKGEQFPLLLVLSNRVFFLVFLSLLIDSIDS
jgi:hypothetical protein